jgi:phospholipase D1/2
VSHPDGSPYIATTAWKDLYSTLKAAEKFIYITGWSVFAETILVRGEDDKHGRSHVGELLKQKAVKGVKVVLLVWNDKSSTDNIDGVMATHDEKTQNYFAGSKVICKLVKREKSDVGMVDSQFVEFCYSHHQKAVICDAPLDKDGYRKRIVSFLGGLDITNGRYDNPTFPLWSTIPTLHKTDFYNNCILGVTAETGPREPWHDCHAKLEGPVVIDILKNFVERCKKQAQDVLPHMYHVKEPEFDLDAKAALPTYEGGLWTSQLFRSISDGSAHFEVDRLKKLCRKEGSYFENSIAKCMVQQIRNAEHFIYLENQYFIGSAYSWFNDRDTTAMHTIPREITHRILEKIAAKQDFKVYALIPMFPEGDPASGPIQEILFWQYRTIESMYGRIGKAIKDAGLKKRPTDYLNFYCLGKRESFDEAPGGLKAPEPGSAAAKAWKSRRHCVYVHSKMTLVDDSYVLVGTANINQRSLGGNRDTEIAVGSYQPGHTVKDEVNPRGGVHTYRMALWAAHLGGADRSYLNPASDECLSKVRKVTKEFWRVYTADAPQHSDVHMLPYPIDVDQEGRVLPLPRPFDCFPDTEAKVLGQKSGFLPVKLTT